MDHNHTISDELNEISPIVGKISALNPYSIPMGYFDQLPGQILQLIGSGAGVDLPVILPEHLNIPYTLPAGYFECLPDIVLNRVKVEQVENVDEELMILSPLLNQLEKKTPFKVPEGYFEDLTGNVLDGAKAIELVNEELENFSPLMSSLKHINAYKVPENYFQQLPHEVLHMARKQPTKVVSLFARKKILRYAAAAIVTGVLVVSSFFFFNGNQSSNIANPVADIQRVSDEEIINYLDYQDITAIDAGTSSASSDINVEDLKEMLTDIPDEELQQYLSQYSDTKQAVVN